MFKMPEELTQLLLSRSVESVNTLILGLMALAALAGWSANRWLSETDRPLISKAIGIITAAVSVAFAVIALSLLWWLFNVRPELT